MTSKGLRADDAASDPADLNERSTDQPTFDRPLTSVGRRFRARVLTNPFVLAPFLAADRNIASRFFFFGDSEAISLPLARDFLSSPVEVLAVDSVSGGDPQAAVMITGMDPGYQHCFISVFKFAETASPFVFGGVLLAIDLVVARWPIRRIRFDVMGFNLPQFALATAHADHEGVRREWVEWDGRTWDSHLFSIARARWEADIRPYVRRWA
jgi:hypothetical protein